MCANKDMGANGVFVMGDCGLNQNPNPEQLADIAASSAESFEYLVGEKGQELPCYPILPTAVQLILMWIK